MSTDERYLQTALRLQRWRDFAAHLTAYIVMNAAFVNRVGTQRWRLLLASVANTWLGSGVELSALPCSHSRVHHPSRSDERSNPPTTLRRGESDPVAAAAEEDTVFNKIGDYRFFTLDLN
jgi:hypothetical protein